MTDANHGEGDRSLSDALEELRDELGMTESEEVTNCGRDVALLHD